MTDDVTVTRERSLPQAAAESLFYETRFTRDSMLIGQFRQLRHMLSEIDERFVGFRYFNDLGLETYDDPDNHILLLLREGRCYGGACLRISTPRHPVMLELENEILPDAGKYYFSLRDRLPQLELDRYAYAEITRAAVHPAIRSMDAMHRLFQAIIDRCIECRVRHLFVVGDTARLRLYKRIFSSFGQTSFIRQDIDIPLRPEYENVKMHLLYGDLKPLYQIESDPDASCLLNPPEHYAFH